MHRCASCSLLAIALVACASAQETGDQSESHPATFGTTVIIPGGLHGTVYFIPKGTTVLPDFQQNPVQRVGEIWTEALMVPPRHWRSGFPGLTERFEWFAIDYNGQFWVDKPERYTFALLSDDGSRLFLDGVPIIDNDCQHPPDLRIAAVKLEGGVHKIRVSYFQGPRDCLALILAIAGADNKWRIFNATEFKPPPNPEDWRYTVSNPVTIVSVTPEEASVTTDELFQRLAEDNPNEKFALKSLAGKGCHSQAPVRICRN